MKTLYIALFVIMVLSVIGYIQAIKEFSTIWPFLAVSTVAGVAGSMAFFKSWMLAYYALCVIGMVSLGIINSFMAASVIAGTVLGVVGYLKSPILQILFSKSLCVY